MCRYRHNYKYAVEEELLEHSPAAHVRRPRLDYESHAAALDRNELGALLVAAGLGPPVEHALISLLALNGLRVSEATGADIEHPGLERGHRTLTITRKGGKVVTIPLAPRTARAIDLAIGERTDGQVFLTGDGWRLDRHGAGRLVRKVARRAGIAKTVTPHTLRHAFITAALPLQFAMMSVAQGSWPAWLGSRWALRWQKSRRNRLSEAARLPQGPELTEAAIQRAGAAGRQLRCRFPRPDHLLQPTALGNVLAAMHDSAGRPYGLDAVISWPRLYPVLGEQARSLVDDRRDTLDGAVRMAATMAVTAIASLVLLSCSGWWVLLALIPLGIAVLAYNAAVQAGLAYAETVHVAFDLHRADLLTALRMELPRRQQPNVP